jgi:hypothetical protein
MLREHASHFADFATERGLSMASTEDNAGTYRAHERSRASGAIANWLAQRTRSPMLAAFRSGVGWKRNISDAANAA